jgi:hypothetical protein
MVPLWLQYDNAYHQRHSKRNASPIEKARSGEPAQFERRDNFYFGIASLRAAARCRPNSAISELDKKNCKAKVNQAFENDWRRNFMKTIQFTVCFLLAMFLCGFGCSSSKPTPDPLAGFHWSSLVNLDNNKAITDDYKDYIQKLPPKEKGYIGDVSFFEDGTGQHAVSIEVFEGNQNASWRHILIYDKENKRIKAIRSGYRRYQS